MSEHCRCKGGRCHAPASVKMSRRDFMGRVSAGAAALSLVGETARAQEKALSLLMPKTTGAKSYPLTAPRVYKGDKLSAVAMPIGGIGTGSIWLNGQGQLGVWQIFNNFTEARIPDSFLAVSARSGSGAPVTRVLATEGEGSLKPVESMPLV